MVGEQGGCCCNHDDHQHNHDQHERIVLATQIPTVTKAADCCGSAQDETSRWSADDNAEHPAARSSS